MNNSLNLSFIKLLIRIGISATFLGHGMFAYYLKESWISYLTVLGFSEASVLNLMPWIGALDFMVALLVLFYPMRIVIFWAFLWTLATAIIRPVSGEPIWDFVERASNWTLPLILLVLQGFPKKAKDWFSTS